MKKAPFLSLCSLAAGLALLFSAPGLAQPATPTAQQALRELKQASMPSFRGQAAGQKQTKQQADEARAQQTAAFVAAARKAREFQTQFPDDPGVAEARQIEVVSLLRAARAGDTTQEEEARKLASAFVADGRNSRHARYIVASMVKQWDVQKKNIKDRSALFAEYEKNARELSADFSDVPEVYYLYLGLVRIAPDAKKAREIASDLLKQPAPPRIKEEAQAVLDRQDLPGKTIPLKFVVDDGTEFELAKNRGTPVVVYLWANMGKGSAIAMPAIRAAVAQYKAVFVGVNLDKDSKAMKTAPDGQPPPGPQLWEPLGMGGPVLRQLKANEIPMVYVFDAEGILRGFGQPGELARLLAEAGAQTISAKL